MQELNGEYNIGTNQEIKWADLWRKTPDNPHDINTIPLSDDDLKNYIYKTLETATKLESIAFIFTVTEMAKSSCKWDPEIFYSFHLQDAFQRIQMDMDNEGFAPFIMDELNNDTIKQLKSACHKITTTGDYVKYRNIYHGVLVENSLYSPGIQLADYAAGVLNGYLRRRLISSNNYQFATAIFEKFIQPYLRKVPNKHLVGTGIVDVPKSTPLRPQLEIIFNGDLPQ